MEFSKALSPPLRKCGALFQLFPTREVLWFAQNLAVWASSTLPSMTLSGLSDGILGNSSKPCVLLSLSLKFVGCNWLKCSSYVGSHQQEGSDAIAGADILDIILTKVGLDNIFLLITILQIVIWSFIWTPSETLFLWVYVAVLCVSGFSSIVFCTETPIW